MEDRAYLSIGEVLSLLKDEFPDVTISKIRFLESQGLLDPERTPSGYRKFYETDVDRLRWILRQQREHFLPLKVIKGRLRGGDDALSDDALESEDGSASAAAQSVSTASSEPAQAGSGQSEAAMSGPAGVSGVGSASATDATSCHPVVQRRPPGAVRAAAVVVQPGG